MVEVKIVSHAREGARQSRGGYRKLRGGVHEEMVREIFKILL